MKIAVIDKAPSKNNYSKYFDFEFELWHMSSVPLQKLLKKDVDLDIDLDYYDLIILVGSEAAKHYAGITSVTNLAGHIVKDKFICITNPAMLVFKPEGKPDFERALDRIKKYVSGESNNINTGIYTGIDNEDEARSYLLEILQYAKDIVAMDTEGTALYPRDGYVLGVSFSYKPNDGRYILTDILNDELIGLIQKIVDTFDIVFHNMKYDIKMIEYHLNIKFRRKHVHDTMVMHYVLDENGAHGLKPLALKYTNFGDYDLDLETFKDAYCKNNDILKDDFTYDLIPFNIICKYAAKDTGVTLELYHKFKPIIDANSNLRRVYYDIMIPGTLFLNDMEEVGIPIDIERMRAADVYLDQEIERNRKLLYTFKELVEFETNEGISFNPNSVVQLRKLLFDYLKLTPTGKLTKGGALSTDAEVLEELSEEHPLPKALLKLRQMQKMRNTYVTKILPEIDRDGRIRTNFNLIFTTSGRLSSSGKFNAQQIVRDDPIIKGCIKAPPGYKIVSQDLTTAEMYYAAVLSGDKNLQLVFSSGGDFHSTIAKMVFDLPCAVEDVKKLYPEMRQSAKAISFGILYGSGPQKVSDTVSKETGKYYGIDRAREDINAYFTKFSKLKKWLNERKTFIEQNGYTYSFFGRKRRLPNVHSADKGIAAHDVRSGINSEIQSIASDVNLLAAIECAQLVKEYKLDAKIFMLVHDSIVALVKDEDIELYCKIIKECTQKDRGCSIKGYPIGVDQDIAQDYSSKKEPTDTLTKFEKVYSFTEYTREDLTIVKSLVRNDS